MVVTRTGALVVGWGQENEGKRMGYLKLHLSPAVFRVAGRRCEGIRVVQRKGTGTGTATIIITTAGGNDGHEGSEGSNGHEGSEGSDGHKGSRISFMPKDVRFTSIPVNLFYSWC